MRRMLIPLLVLTLGTTPALGAPPKPRPVAGSGIVILRAPAQQETAAGGWIILYREPGIGRIAEKSLRELPLLTQIVGDADGEYPVAVMGKRGAWLKISYDDAGREGWVEMERRWHYTSWEDFLQGRAVRILPGLKKGYALLRKEPSPSAGEVAPVSPDRALRIELVQGDWLRIGFTPQTVGWLRWRDENGRFLVSIPADNGQQKH
jgi:hypothetical protein